MLKNNIKKQSGYTILETMVAIGLFLVVVILGIGSLLNSTLLYKKSQNMRSVLDNMSFVIEDMSRNLRAGYDYHCIDDGDTLATAPHDCSNGAGISFKSSLGGQQIVYTINGSNQIQKSIQGGAAGTFILMTLPEVYIDPISSGFKVVGALPPSGGDQRQPIVTIKLVGHITENNAVSPFSFQTSVSQRLVDITI